MENHFFTPIFYRDGNLLVFPSPNLIGTTETLAQAIGEMNAASLHAITGAEFTGEALRIGHRPQRYVRAQIGSIRVAVLSGPVMTRALAALAA